MTCIFAARVDLAMQHRRHVVCLFRQQQMKVQLVTQRCTAPRISGTTSSAEMHHVLDPDGTSVDVARRRAERRGPKTCLQKSRTWNQLAPCGLRPGPLAFSCMAMTLHTGEALALIHSHANSFVITNDFWYVSVLVGNGNESFAGVLQIFLGVLYASMSAEQALADLNTSPSQWIAATFSCHC